MSPQSQVARRDVKITNSLGLHLRPANKFVNVAHQFQADIRVFHNGHEINGKSILDLTTLAAECGAELILEARGPDAEAAVAALAELVLSRFDDDEDDLDTSAGQVPVKDPAP
jgi:phosphotransferase system HPr (HPr) family protein